MPVLVDAEGAVKTWASGLGIKVALVAQRSGPAYVMLSRIGGVPEDVGRDVARISAVGHGRTRQEALNVAVEFANAVFDLQPGLLDTGVYCTSADVDSGPTEIPDASGASRYSVEVSFFLGAV